MNIGSPLPLDGEGLCGYLLHYSFIIILVGGALFIFIFLWKKGRLDMDEEPKYQMMKPDRENEDSKDDKHEKE